MSNNNTNDMQSNPFGSNFIDSHSIFYDSNSSHGEDHTDAFGLPPFVPTDSTITTSSSSYSSSTSNHNAVSKSKSSFYSELPDTTNFHFPTTTSSFHSVGSVGSVASVGSNPLAARESAIQAQMLTREKEYVDMQSFRIFIGTWNVNGQIASESLKEHWLASDPSPPDIYAIGFQELDLSKEAFIFTDSPREAEWLKACIEGLHPKGNYYMVKFVRLVGMMLVVFAREELRSQISEEYAETVGTGILGTMGNKGGVAIRFKFFNTTLCFVNSHLAAHVEEYEKRNQDYKEICSRLMFNRMSPPCGIKDHNQVYWLGDLNYRLMDLTTDQVMLMLTSDRYSALLERDQLQCQMREKNVFVDFIEGPIRHLPTYKYDPGTDNWDSSEKNRAPAWCDRILWKGGPTKQLIYRSHPKMMLSDHKPVSALFEASIKVKDEKKYRKVYEDEMKKFDRLENEYLPQVSLDKVEVKYGNITFKESLVEFLTVANTGQVPVKFEFIKKLDDKSYCKEWLRIKPYTSLITPGNKIDIEIEAFVDVGSAYKLNSGEDTLNDILVLHLEGGKDLFITVSGNYQPSVFGCSIDTLVRLKCPLRDLSFETLKNVLTKKNESVMNEFPIVWDIPKELWILIDPLYKYGMTLEYLFQQNGLMSDFAKTRDTLDSGWPDKLTGSVYAIAEALLIFLSSLSEPIIPYNLYLASLEASSNFTNCQKVINNLPQAHRNVFYYLIAFLRELLRHSNSNKLEASMLATVFGSIILRASPEQLKTLQEDKATERKKSAFMYNFFVNDFDV